MLEVKLSTLVMHFCIWRLKAQIVHKLFPEHPATKGGLCNLEISERAGGAGFARAHTDRARVRAEDIDLKMVPLPPHSLRSQKGFFTADLPMVIEHTTGACSQQPGGCIDQAYIQKGKVL